ncbi:hypothetical protein JCM8115_002973 [Rhodotorula mucilaginosa]
MPVALARYLEPYNAYLRPLGYYATWTFYFLSFTVSPGLVTLLQALCLVLTWILPSVELNVERGRRRILASRWIQPEWAWPDAVPFHRREWPQWARNAASYFDLRPTLAVAWNACAARLRALSRRMGWDIEAPHAAGARRASNPFSVAGHSARSIPTRTPRIHSASLREGVAGPAWSVASAREAAGMRDDDGSFWGDDGSWKGA